MKYFSGHKHAALQIHSAAYSFLSAVCQTAASVIAAVFTSIVVIVCRFESRLESRVETIDPARFKSGIESGLKTDTAVSHGASAAVPSDTVISISIHMIKSP